MLNGTCHRAGTDTQGCDRKRPVAQNAEAVRGESPREAPLFALVAIQTQPHSGLCSIPKRSAERSPENKAEKRC
jgi:hypothetical protein